MASSLDTIGPFATTVEDLAMVLEHIAGFDPHDSTTSQTAVEPYSTLYDQPVEKLRIGVAKEYFALPELNQDIKKIIEGIIQQLGQTGAEIIPVTMPHTKYAVPTYYVIVPSEVSANLARFDGIRYGYRASDPIQMYLEDIFVAPASLAGVPALVVPAGQAQHLPVGVQIIGPQFSEALLLRVGRMIERLPKRS